MSVIVVEHDEDTILAADHTRTSAPLRIARRPDRPRRARSKILAWTNSLPPIPSQARRASRAEHRNARSSRGVRRIAGLAWNLARRDRQQPKEVTGAFPAGASSPASPASARGNPRASMTFCGACCLSPFLSARRNVGKATLADGLAQVDKASSSTRPRSASPPFEPRDHTGAFGPIRDLLLGLPASRIRGYDGAALASRQGAAAKPSGRRAEKIDDPSSADVYVGARSAAPRYNRETLEDTYRAEHRRRLDRTVDEGARFFAMSRKSPSSCSHAKMWDSATCTWAERHDRSGG